METVSSNVPASTVTTIYDQGVLYLLEPLALPNATKVQVQILPSETAAPPTDMAIHYLSRLRDTLSQLARPWSQDVIYQAYVNIFRNDLITLWQLSIAQQSRLCATLMLAIQAIHTAQLSAEQVATIRFILDKLEHTQLSQVDIDECYLKLLDAHLFLTPNLDDEAIQSYLDEI